MKRDLRLFIGDILINIEAIEQFSDELTKAQFIKNKEKQYAVIRAIEIIGEAAKKVPTSLRKKHPNIPWKEIAGSRDRIIHAYFKVDLDVVWNIIKYHLPTLKKHIKEILETETV